MTSSSDNILRVGLIGAGFLARTRARCWNKVHGMRVELAGVAAGSRASAEAFAREHGVARVFDDAQELIERSEADLIDLCAPNHLHRPLAEAASRAKKSVLCTKPLAAYVGQDLDAPTNEAVAGRDRADMFRVAVGDARAMVRAAADNGVHLHYGENWVYAPAIQRAQDLARRSQGRLLEMHGWEAHSGSHSAFSKEWRHAGGGALIRLAAHPIGTMLWLKREEGLRLNGRPTRVETVTAEVADLTAGLDPKTEVAVATGWRGVENWGTCVLGFDDGSRGVAYGSDNLLGGMQSKLRLLASDHHLECNLSPNDLLRAYAPSEGVFGDAYVMEKAHGQAGWSTPIPDEDWSSGQQGLCQAVAEAALAGVASAADGELGCDVTRVVYGAYVSAATGRRVQLTELEA